MAKLQKLPQRIKPADERLKAGGSWRDGLTSSTARGYDYQWQKYRADYLAANPFCAIKGAGCLIVATIVDHITPHRGNRALFLDPRNHQPACEHCHNVHKQRQERRNA